MCISNKSVSRELSADDSRLLLIWEFFRSCFMDGKRLATTVAQLAVTGVAIALNSPTVLAQQQGGGVNALAGNLENAVQGFGNLILLIAMALLGAGLTIRFLPTGSHRTKEAAGSLIDNALILAGLVALGTYLLVFAGQWATTIAGSGGEISPSGAWGPPSIR